MNGMDIAEQAYINGYKKGVEDLAIRLKSKAKQMYSLGIGYCYVEIKQFNEIVKELTAGGEELTKPVETPCKHAIKDELGDSYCGNDKSENLGDFCVCCGATIPEGRQVCPNCEKEE